MDTIMSFLLRKYDRVNINLKKKARLYFYLLGILLIHSIFVLLMTLFIEINNDEILIVILSIVVYLLLGFSLYFAKIQATLYLFSIYVIARSIYLISIEHYIVLIGFLSLTILFLGLFRKNKRQYYVLISIPLLLTLYGIYYAIESLNYDGVVLFNLIETSLYLILTIGFIYFFSEILEKEELESKTLHEKSTMGLLMKAHERRGKDKVKEMLKIDTRTSLLIVAVDHYQEINNEYGNEQGDNVLKAVLNIIRNKIRIDDYIIRWNHEDFLVVLNFTPLSNAGIVAEKIRRVVELSKFSITKEKITVTIACVTNRKTMHETIIKAEELLVKTKSNNENHIELDFS